MTPPRQWLRGALLCLCVALCAASASADEGPDASLKTPTWLAPRSSAPRAVASGPHVGLGRSLGVLLLTSVLGGAALYLRSSKSKKPAAKLAHLRVIGATKLGGRAQLILAEVAGRKILLGVTDSSVSKLGWLEPEAEEDELFAPRPRAIGSGLDHAVRPSQSSVEPASTASPKRSFRDFLASAVGNLGRPDDESAALTIAVETRDTFTRSAPLAKDARQREGARPAQPQMLDVEGQARGLLARLGNHRP
jgi:flagellar biogenesis protein FliO